MFISNEDLTLLKEINADLNNEKLDALIKKYEKSMEENSGHAKNKIAYMRSHGFPYYARPKTIQEKHYSRCFKDIEYYINKNEKEIAFDILDRIINENNYNFKQLYYFMETIPKELMNFYHEYKNK